MTWKKKLLSIVLCLCALLTVVATAGAEGEIAEGTAGSTDHSHKLCAGLTSCTDPEHASGDHGTDVTFAKKLSQKNGKLYIDNEEWKLSDNNGYLLKSGCYYLATDLDLGEYPIRLSNTSDVNVTLCLNGHKITRTAPHDGTNSTAIIAPFSAAAKFTLCDCEGSGQITHADTMTDGAGMGADSNNAKAQFIMYNGCITGNKGSGVYVYGKMSFTMYGGSITGNSSNGDSSYGGGVFVGSGAAFTMYGGSITNNGAEYGGGVSVSGTFTMHGGSIDGNHASKVGGGIYSGSSSNTIKILGGSVTNNSVSKTGDQWTIAKAGGIYVHGSGTLTIGGNVNISGNWQGDAQSSASNDNASNVYLSANSTITIEKALTGENSRIGVTTATPVATTKDASVKIAAGKGAYVIKDADKDHFTPDTGYCEIQKKDDGALYLTHVHSGGTATCTAAAKCGGCNASYGDKNLNNHTGTVGSEWKTDNTYHWKVYNCCNTEYGKAQHTYDKEVVNPIYLKAAATCKQYAVYYKSCVCGKWSTDADTFEDVNGGKNTANHAGTSGSEWTGTDEIKHWKQWSCCGAQVSGTDEAHSGTKWTVGEVTTPATCMTAGVRTYTCEVCGKVKTEEISAIGHNFTDDTYLSDDTQHWKQCKNCTAISEKTDHNVVTDEAKPATTTGTGLTEGKHCGVCGKVFVAQEVTPKLSPRYYYNRTTTTTKDTTKNPGTFDPGVGIYALTAVLSVTGMAYVGKKKF